MCVCVCLLVFERNTLPFCPLPVDVSDKGGGLAYNGLTIQRTASMVYLHLCFLFLLSNATSRPRQFVTQRGLRFFSDSLTV